MRGALLTGANFGSQNVLRLAGNLVLTRILFPEAFGIMALVQVFLTGLNMFSDIGVNASIIQNKRGTDPVFLDTAWMLQILRGVVLWLLTCLAAAPLANFYDAPILAQLLPVAGLTALIQGFKSTKIATANRELRLGRVTVISISSKVVGIGAVIGLALWWQSVWALAVGGLVAPLWVVIGSHLFVPGHNNRFRFEIAAARELVDFGKFILIATIAGFLVAQADRAILGKFISLSELAYYNIAYFMAMIPRMVQQRLASNILFPLYSNRPPGESSENYRNLARMRLVFVGLTMSLAGVLAISGDFVIRLLYDTRYEAAGPILILIVISSLPSIVTGNYGAMILASGNSKRFSNMVVLSAVLKTTILYFAIVNFGVVGAALTPLLSQTLLYPFMVWLIWPYKGWVPMQDLGYVILACAITALAVWLNYDVLAATFAAIP